MTIALPGDFGKPCPALVIQSDQFAGTASVTVLLLSSTVVDAPLIRLDVEPAPENGLRRRSQVMVDKSMTVKRERVGEAFGHLDDSDMVAVNRALAVFLGFS
nr:type II toxin-antitoxin system PemK/MazF family toxin [Halomonas sp. NO4]